MCKICEAAKIKRQKKKSTVQDFQTIDSRRHDDDLDEADEEKDEGGTGHVSPEPGVYLFGVLQEIKESETALEGILSHSVPMKSGLDQ